MLEELNWMSIKQRVNWNCLKFIHKVKQGYAPEYLLQLLNTVGETHQYPTRQKTNFYIEPTNLVSTDRMIFLDGLRLYNEVISSYQREKDEDKIKIGIYNYFKYYVKLKF